MYKLPTKNILEKLLNKELAKVTYTLNTITFNFISDYISSDEFDINVTGNFYYKDINSDKSIHIYEIYPLTEDFNLTSLLGKLVSAIEILDDETTFKIVFNNGSILELHSDIYYEYYDLYPEGKDKQKFTI